MIVSETDKSLGKKLRQLREGRGLSQEKLAREIGVVFQQIQKYEAGINRISCSRLLKILDVLDISCSGQNGFAKLAKWFCIAFKV